MGLLDEAIRDHLELKRRAGADPAEIAHAERAALEPVFPDEPAADDDVTEPRATAVAREPAAPAEGDEPVAQLAEETVEIDMAAVLAEDDGSKAQAVMAEADDGFEWEVPAERDDDAAASDEPGGPPEQIPGQERMSLE